MAQDVTTTAEAFIAPAARPEQAARRRSASRLDVDDGRVDVCKRGVPVARFSAAAEALAGDRVPRRVRGRGRSIRPDLGSDRDCASEGGGMTTKPKFTVIDRTVDPPRILPDHEADAILELCAKPLTEAQYARMDSLCRATAAYREGASGASIAEVVAAHPEIDRDELVSYLEALIRFPNGP